MIFASKSRDRFNFLLGCFTGVLGKGKEEERSGKAAKKRGDEGSANVAGRERGDGGRVENSMELKLYQ